VETFIFLLLLIIAGLFWRTIQKAKTEQLNLEESVKCPTCRKILTIEEMLDNALYYGAGAIVFNCEKCNDQAYFWPHESHIEIGRLACSPVIDPIPYGNAAYTVGFEMQSSIQDNILSIQIEKNCWEITKYQP
jgi:hypothetical protein